LASILWSPEFDWAHYYFVELQAPEKKIEKGLDLWLAAKLAAGDSTPLPWSSATEMYATIDSIQEGDAPFETISFKYSGSLLPNPPHWMMETYKLCMHDARLLLHNQLRTTDFKDQINLRPYRQFNHQGNHVWSNLMSGDWGWNEAVRYIYIE
jgi:Plavaka transposase